MIVAVIKQAMAVNFQTRPSCREMLAMTISPDLNNRAPICPGIVSNWKQSIFARYNMSPISKVVFPEKW
jgi:hypothetical protein